MGLTIDDFGFTIFACPSAAFAKAGFTIFACPYAAITKTEITIYENRKAIPQSDTKEARSFAKENLE